LHFCRSHYNHQIIITHRGAASYPPPSLMVLVCYNRRSSMPVGTLQSTSALLNPPRHSSIPSALLSLDWYFDISFSTPYFHFGQHSSSVMGTLQSPIRGAFISFQTLDLPPRSPLLSMNGQPRCIGASQSPLALFGLDLCPSNSFCITISTPPDHLT
jgi:hypothetical protein